MLIKAGEWNKLSKAEKMALLLAAYKKSQKNKPALKKAQA